MIAYCGLECDSCPVHLATLEKDESLKQNMRVSIAEQCFEEYGMKLKPGDITDCDGCQADNGRVFSGCLNCEIRKCAMMKKIDSCAYCDDYPCEILSNNFSHDPDARKRLESIRRLYKP